MFLEEPLRQNGFALTHTLVDAHHCDLLLAELEVLDPGHDHARGGIRNVLSRSPRARALVRGRAIRPLIEPLMSKDAFAVRGIYFAKSPQANWAARWHQDTVVPLRERRDVEGFSAWSEKAGVIHAKAPVEVLERMLILRLHLDDVDADNGCLQVLPGSHRCGLGDRPDVDPAEVHGTIGTALLMRPLLWHASAKARTDRPRRVLHLEFADQDLPGGLDWAERW